MSKNWFSRFMPTQKEVTEHKYLRFLGSLLHHKELWRFNERTVPKSVGVGVFCAFMPMPFQMIIAAILAVGCEANLPLSIAFVWISNPITMPPMFYGAYILGKWCLNSPDLIQSGQSISIAFFADNFKVIWKPFLLGTTVCGIIFGIISYFIAKWAWYYRERRKQQKLARKLKNNVF